MTQEHRYTVSGLWHIVNVNINDGRHLLHLCSWFSSHLGRICTWHFQSLSDELSPHTLGDCIANHDLDLFAAWVHFPHLAFQSVQGTLACIKRDHGHRDCCWPWHSRVPHVWTNCAVLQNLPQPPNNIRPHQQPTDPIGSRVQRRLTTN